VTENFRKFSQVKTFRKISVNFPYDVRASLNFYLLILYRIIYVFHSINYVSRNFPEIFITKPDSSFICIKIKQKAHYACAPI
jgi:hypothetical protein